MGRSRLFIAISSSSSRQLEFLYKMDCLQSKFSFDELSWSDFGVSGSAMGFGVRLEPWIEGIHAN